MVQKVQTTLISDVSGQEGDETVTFGLDGTTYEIDVTSSEASDLREALADYIGHARKQTGRNGSRRGSGRATTGVQAETGVSPKAVREWAAANGIEWKGKPLPERGRIPAEVIEKFKAAGN